MMANFTLGKRGATLKTDLYGFFPGFAGYERLRHKFSPSFSYEWSPEVEPVPRHIARIQVANKNKEVFGIFVAPEIDPNTVLSFFNSRKYSIENSLIELTIIPLTIDQIKIILSIFRDKRFTVKDMNRLLKTMQREMTATPDAIQWHKKLPALINEWAEAL